MTNTKHLWKTTIKYCVNCEKETVHVLTASGDRYYCACGVYILVENITKSDAESKEGTK